MTEQPDEEQLEFADVKPPPRSWKTRLAELIVVFVTIVALIALLLPAVRQPSKAARRTQCRNNLKQIGLALHNYHSDYGSFPPAYTVDAVGNPLHSWRTLILPYLDQQALYDTIDLSKPWDDPANAAAVATPVPCYVCPSTDLNLNQTVYLAVVTPNSCLRPVESVDLAEITDGTSNTLVAIEVPVNCAVPWMAPWDADARLVLSPKSEEDYHHPGVTFGLFADGSCLPLLADQPTAELRSQISVAGGDNVNADAEVSQ